MSKRMIRLRSKLPIFSRIVSALIIAMAVTACNTVSTPGLPTPAQTPDVPSDNGDSSSEQHTAPPRDEDTSLGSGETPSDQDPEAVDAIDPNPPHSVDNDGDSETVHDIDAIRHQYDPSDASSIAVLVNKLYGLPEQYEPDDLVKVDIPFVYKDDSVHSMRQVAADALIEMFEASKEDGYELAGVSGYRSYAIQKMLYEKYVARDGEEAASKYSAKPGHSEHSTGLAMDVAGISGKCAANNCFADTEEAAWLAEHAHEFGFIIRYPKGKEEITGYQYEPWHLRYVGEELAKILHENEWTMEEFFLQEQIS